MSASEHRPLFSEFSAISQEEWMEKVLADLKGKPYEKLFWKHPSGLVTAPMAMNTSPSGGLPGQDSFRRGSVFLADDAGWQVVQDLIPGSGMEQIEDAVNAEVHAFQIDGTAQDLNEILSQMNLSESAIHVYNSSAETLSAISTAAGAQTGQLTGTATFQVFSDSLTTAGLTTDPADLRSMISMSSDSPYFRALGIDLRQTELIGGTPDVQLAIALAGVVELLETIPNDDITAEEVLENLHFRFPTGDSFFLEVAKYRAFRVLFSDLVKSYGHDSPGLISPFVMAMTSRRTLARYDQHTNLLRQTTSAMAAVLGGAEAILIEPFDILEGSAGKTGSRLARNIQFLLKHESYLDQVKDIGGGSYYLEGLTKSVGEKAWEIFLAIQETGGIRPFIDAGKLEPYCSPDRRMSMIGVNQSANPQETRDLTIEENDPRSAAGFERLRSQIDRLGRERGKRLTAFFWQFGDVRMRNARAQFSRDVLAAAGIAPIDNKKPNDIEASMAQFRASEADLLVLCSSDAEYFEQGKTLIEQVKADSSAFPVVIAGNPEGIASTGTDYTIHARMDRLGFLVELCGRWLK